MSLACILPTAGAESDVTTDPGATAVALLSCVTIDTSRVPPVHTEPCNLLTT